MDELEAAPAPDNFVEYAVFPDMGSFELPSSTSARGQQGAGVQGPSLAAHGQPVAVDGVQLGLELLRVACMDCIAPQLEGFIWNLEPFALTVASAAVPGTISTPLCPPRTFEQPGSKNSVMAI